MPWEKRDLSLQLPIISFLGIAMYLVNFITLADMVIIVEEIGPNNWDTIVIVVFCY